MTDSFKFLNDLKNANRRDNLYSLRSLKDKSLIEKYSFDKANL